MFFLTVCVVFVYLPGLGISFFDIDLRVRMGSAFFACFSCFPFFMFLSSLSWVILVSFFVTFGGHLGGLSGAFSDVPKRGVGHPNQAYDQPVGEGLPLPLPGIG